MLARIKKNKGNIEVAHDGCYFIPFDKEIHYEELESFNVNTSHSEHIQQQKRRKNIWSTDACIVYKHNSFIIKNKRNPTNWNMEKQPFSSNSIPEMISILHTYLHKYNFYNIQINDIRHILKPNWGEFVIISVMMTDDKYDEIDLQFIFRKYLLSPDNDYLDLLF